MTDVLRPDLCVIGAGSAGLSIAAGAVQMGASVVLIEAGRMGGDCLNTGCVPSKSLLAAAKAAHAVRAAARFGVNGPGLNSGEPVIDFAAVSAHVRGVIAGIAPHDSEERFRGLGCTVIRAPARFLDDRTVAAGDARIRARRFVVATGGRPAVPSLPGLNDVNFLTNENIFDLAALPQHLLILGGGPIGCELAQAFRRLGAAVTMVVRSGVLPKDDPAAVAVVRRALRDDGVAVLEHAGVDRVEADGAGVVLHLGVSGLGEGGRLCGSHLLAATGRRANIDGLDLDKAGVRFSAAGIAVDDRLRTDNRRIFAAGDVVGGPQFTHWAAYQAGIVIRNALLRLPAKVDARALPRVTYTDPELAQVGLSEAAARAAHGDRLRVLTADFADNDRARTERTDGGFVKVLTDGRGRILGATVVGPQAGELIQTWCLALSAGLKIGAVAGMIAPYPTLGESNKRAAGSFFTPTLFGPWMRRLVRLSARLG